MIKYNVQSLRVLMIVFIVEVFVSRVTVRNEPKFTVGSPYMDIKLQILTVLKISIGQINY